MKITSNIKLDIPKCNICTWALSTTCNGVDVSILKCVVLIVISYGPSNHCGGRYFTWLKKLCVLRGFMRLVK